VVAPITKKNSEVVDDEDAAGVAKTSKIRRIDPSEVAASGPAEKHERGILPWVNS
jgi:hypothetical protein